MRRGPHGRPSSHPFVGVAAQAGSALSRLRVSAPLTWSPAGLRYLDSNRFLYRAQRGRNLPPAAQRERPGPPPHWPAARAPCPARPHWLLGAPRPPRAHAHWPPFMCPPLPSPLASRPPRPRRLPGVGGAWWLRVAGGVRVHSRLDPKSTHAGSPRTTRKRVLADSPRAVRGAGVWPHSPAYFLGSRPF